MREKGPGLFGADAERIGVTGASAGGWSAGGLRRILRPVTDPYTYWLATTDARERSVKRLMQELHGGSVKSIIEELVRLTGHCRTTDERLAILEPYIEKCLAERCEAV